MEKNIQDDRLDDYVRKSFEDYEEAPASDMWGRIEEELPPVAPESGTTAGRPPIRRYLWQLTAAASILLLISSLVCGRLYYENKIREISALQGTEQPPDTQKSVQAPYPAGVLIQIAKHLYKSFLQYILRILAAMGIAEAQGKHFAFKTFEKLLLSEAVAAKTGLQIGFGHAGSRSVYTR